MYARTQPIDTLHRSLALGQAKLCAKACTHENPMEIICKGGSLFAPGNVAFGFNTTDVLGYKLVCPKAHE